MSLDGYHSILVLGGIRSGKSAFAESLVGNGADVRYVATAAPIRDDPEWDGRIEAHRGRRPADWATEEIGEAPRRLAALLAEARPGQTLLIDDLGGWLTALLEEVGWSADSVAEPVAGLVAAVRECAGRVVVVSPEAGLSVVPATGSGRAFADAIGTANQSLAGACDAAVLVVAGQAAWLKPAPGPARAPSAPTTTAAVPTTPPSAPTATAALPAEPLMEPLAPADTAPPVPAGPAAEDSAGVPFPLGGPDRDLSITDALTGPTLVLKTLPHASVIQVDTGLPMPDEAAESAVGQRMSALDVDGPGLGRLGRAVRFAAGAQGSRYPRPFRSVRVLLLHGDHAGGLAAGDTAGASAARVQQSRQGAGPLGVLATEAGARLQVVELGDSDRRVAQPIEDGEAIDYDRVDAALRQGWNLADTAIDEGADLLVIAAAGAGQQSAAAAVVAANTTTEAATLLPRVLRPGGKIDDEAWMVRCAAIRDGLRGLLGRNRDARVVLSAVAGEDIAVAAGVMLGASARRTPVMIDGPVGVAAALMARDISAVTRHWILLAEHGNQPTVRAAAEVMGLEPLLDLGLGLGEGASCLAALPLVRSALTIMESA